MVAAMDTVIFGAQGQLGHALAARLPDARAVGRAMCDVTNAAQISAVLSGGARVVYNATAYNHVDKAEHQADEAFAINGFAPGRLAAAARAVSSRFVHYSTDYVFGDGHLMPIDETQQPAPLSVYGRSKLHGELLARQNNPDTLVIRTTGLYSHHRHNFVKTMINLAVSGRRMTVVSDQRVSPTWAESLADTSVELAEADVVGVYHVTAQGECSWFQLAGRIMEILGITGDLHPVDQVTWGAAARRPAYSALDDAMLRATGIARLGRWDDELERFLHKHGAALLEEASTT